MLMINAETKIFLYLPSTDMRKSIDSLCVLIADQLSLNPADGHSLALGRKNYLFMGSPEGAKAGAIFYSLLATSTANNIEPYKYFCTMLHQIRLCKTEDDYRKLLPQSIK